MTSLRYVTFDHAIADDVHTYCMTGDSWAFGIHLRWNCVPIGVVIAMCGCYNALSTLGWTRVKINALPKVAKP